MKRKMKCDEKIRGKEKRGEEEVGGCERKKAAFRGWVSVARARRRGNLLCPVTVNDVQLYYLLRYNVSVLSFVSSHENVPGSMNNAKGTSVYSGCRK